MVGDGVARPTALLGDLSPGFGDADLSKVGKSLDLGMADGLLDSILPNGIGDSVAGDDGVFDAVIDLLGSIDDAIVDLAKGILSFTRTGGDPHMISVTTAEASRPRVVAPPGWTIGSTEVVSPGGGRPSGH